MKELGFVALVEQVGVEKEKEEFLTSYLQASNPSKGNYCGSLGKSDRVVDEYELNGMFGIGTRE